MRKSMLTVLGAAVALTVAPFVQADDTAALRAELDAMKAELAQLKNEQGETWMNERRAEEVKTLVNEALSDAETRATLLQDGAMAGHDGKKFFLQSADGSFRLNIQGQIQFRYVYAHTRDDARHDRQDNEGFELRRVKLKFNGHIGDPKIKFKITLASSRESANVYLEEAVVSYDITDWLSVYGGRLKAPFARAELVSSSRQLAVDRSYVTEQFTWGFAEGIGLTAQPMDALKLNVMLNDGPNSGADGNDNRFRTDQDSHFAIAGRAEYLVFGDWKTMKGFNGFSGDEASLMLGAAVGYANAQPLNSSGIFGYIPSGVTFPSTTKNNSYNFTADASFKMQGWAFFAAGYARYDNYYDGGEEGTIENYGAVAQVSYNIDDTFEPYGRFEYIAMGHHGPGENTDGYIGTVGMNWFLKKNAAKFTTDVMYFFQPTNETGGGSSGIGVIGSDKGDQIVFRAQFQLLF